MIVETEAYRGVTDRASHAFNNRRTPRTEVMFAEGGLSYVYLCYGIHHLFNVITNRNEIPHAVLIRAIEPFDGIDIMLSRTKKKIARRDLTAGPGALTKALGISLLHNKIDITNNKKIWIEDRGINISNQKILSSPRVGVESAGADAALPYRFRIKGNNWTSPAK